MNIFNLFLKDPLNSWGKKSKQKLYLDLSDFTLNNLKIGSNKNEIIKFGRPNNKKAYKKNYFEYYENGLIIETEKDKIIYFAVIIDKDEFSDKFSNADLYISNPGSDPIFVANGMIRSDLIKIINLELKGTDKDEIEIIDYIKKEDHIIEVESFANERVKRINIYKS
ncbi:MAG: hypothetical protein RBR08_01830 [Desulforegulaceae bacterium]|nr:hypothetical protein [Desulforegulaceae bacterium]